MNKIVSIFMLSTMTSTSPSLHNLQNQSHTQKAERSLIYAAAGDAFGRVTEFIPSIDKIFAKYPNGITSSKDFKPSDWLDIPTEFKDKQIAPYTDDTAMAILVLKALKSSKKHDYGIDETMSLIAYNFIKDSKRALGWKADFRAPGNCCMEYVSELESQFKNGNLSPRWWAVSPADGKTGGCGSVMRAYPFGLVFADEPEKAKDWAAQHSLLTHGDSLSKASCAAMAIGTALAMQNRDKDYIIKTMIAAAQEYDNVTATKLQEAYKRSEQAKKIVGKQDPYKALLNPSNQFRKHHEEFFKEFLGWAAHDAMAGVVYLFNLCAQDAELAIFLGVHTPGDSDSIASLAGALCGAYSNEAIDLLVKFNNIENYELIRSMAKDLN